MTENDGKWGMTDETRYTAGAAALPGQGAGGGLSGPGLVSAAAGAVRGHPAEGAAGGGEAGRLPSLRTGALRRPDLALPIGERGPGDGGGHAGTDPGAAGDGLRHLPADGRPAAALRRPLAVEAPGALDERLKLREKPPRRAVFS